MQQQPPLHTAQFKALGHPMRHRLLVVLRQRPATLAQLAAALAAAKGTVDYHLRILVDAGLAHVSSTRTVRGGTERYYEPVGSALTHPDNRSAAELMLPAALAEMVTSTPDAPDLTILRHLRLTDRTARKLAALLHDLVHEQQPEPTGNQYGLLVALFQADIPTLPPEQLPQ